MGIFSALLGNAGSVSQEDLLKNYGQLLTDNESIEMGFKLIRDTFIFTNKRSGIWFRKRSYQSFEIYKSKMDSGSTKRKNSKNSIQPSNNDKNGSGIKVKEKAEFRFCFFFVLL